MRGTKVYKFTKSTKKQLSINNLMKIRKLGCIPTIKVNLYYTCGGHVIKSKNHYNQFCVCVEERSSYR